MRIKNRKKLLDAGCRFGQDIRKLVMDGAAPEDIHRLEIENKFADPGYDLFRDRGKLHLLLVTFWTIRSSWPLIGKIDILAAIKLMHFRNWEGQFKVACRLAKYCGHGRDL
jgi:hypothetical protein